ncbi:LPD38 domain-containing protein [Muribaculum intestinale]|uniref:LPD38 domain-containing protein n=1 Tax=Muribaculum intestinale TaxID=1796646 RepID=UPI00242D4CFF|nr:LPD38 domain-containing protein [Muribaculum intestinale]
MAKEANESTKWLYEQLKGKGYNVGKDVNEFDSLMRTNADSRQWAYDTATKSGLNVGKDIAEFSSLVGGTSPSSPVADLSPATTDSTAEVEPTVENKEQEEGWKPTPMQKAFMMGEIQSGVDSTLERMQQSVESTRRLAESRTEEGRNRRKAAEMRARIIGTPTKVLGLTPNTSPATEGNSDTPKGQSNPNSPVVHGIKLEDGVAKTEWMLSDGSLSTSLIDADKAEYGARQARLQYEFIKRMEQNGLNPAKEGDVEKQKQKDLLDSAEKQTRIRLAENEENLHELYDNRAKRLDEQGEWNDDEGFWSNFVRIVGGAANRSVTANAPKPRQYMTAEDKDIGTYLTENQVLTDAKKLLETRKLNKSDGFMGGFWKIGNNWRNLKMGARHALSDADLYVGGVMALQKATQLMDVEEKLKQGTDLTDAEVSLVYSTMLGQDVRDNIETPHGYNAAQITVEMFPFMAQMALNPASGLSRALVTKYGKSGLRKIAMRKAAQGLTGEAAEAFAKKETRKLAAKTVGVQVLGDVAEASVLANTLQAPKTAANAIERYQGNVVEDENGNISFDGSHNWGEAIYKAETSAIIENYTEMLGEHFGIIGNAIGKGVGKGLRAVGGGKIVDAVSDMIGKIGSNEWAKAIGEVEKRAHWNGTVGEVLEEEAGIVLNSIFTGDNKISDLWDADQQIDIVLGVGLFGGFVSGLKTVGYPVAKAKAKGNLRKSNSICSWRFGEDWGEIRSQIENADEKDLGIVIRDLVRTHAKSDEQGKAIVEYAHSLMKARGYEIASATTRAEGTSTPEQQDIEESFEHGEQLVESEDTQAMNDAKKMLDLQRGRLASALSEDLVQDFDNDPIGALSVTHDPELRHIASDYVNAKAVYDGMIQRVRDDVDGRIAQSNAMIDSRINRETGMIQPAAMKADDRRVYIVNGTVAMFEDGTGVDTNNSSGSIIIRDAETGKVEFADPTQFHSVDEAVDAETEKEAARKQIIDEIAVAAANNIDGVLSFTPGESYSVLDIDGNPEDIAILGQPTDENGIPLDGYVDIQYPDGTIQSVATSDLQQWVDAANTRRVEQFDNERQAQRAAEDEAVRQADQSGLSNPNRRTDLMPDDYKTPYDNRPVRATRYIESENGTGGTLYQDENGNDAVVIAAIDDNNYVGYFREYDEQGNPTDRWSAKFQNGSGIRENHRDMMLTAQELLPAGHELTEHTSVSTDGLRNLANQLKHGYELQYDEQGNIVTTEVAVNMMARDNTLGLSDYEPGSIDPARVSSEEYREAASRLIPYMEALGLSKFNIHWEDGTMYVDHPILKRADTPQQEVQPVVTENAETVPNSDENTEIPTENRDLASETVPKTENSVENVQQTADDGFIPIDPALINSRTDENGNIIWDEPQQEQSRSEEHKQSALSRVPLNEKGKPDFGAVDADTAWDAIVEKTSNEAMAQSFAENMVAASEAELKKAEKVKTQPTTDLDEFIAADSERIANIDRAKTALDHWKKVAGTKQRRQAEADAVRSAEMRKRAEEARIKAEQEREEREEAERWEAEKRGLDKRLRDTAESVRHVPEAVEVLKDMNPQSIDEVASWLLSRHKVIWSDTKRGGVRIKYGVASHTGFGEGERRKLFGLFASAEKGGISLDRLSEDLFKEACDVFGVAYDNKSARDALIERIGEARTMGDILNYIANNRIARATRVAAEFDAYEAEQREEHYQEAYHMGYDEYEAYEGQMLVEMENAFRNFDEQEFYGNIADELVNQQRYGLRSNEEAVGEREVAADDGGVEVLSGTKSGEAGGAPSNVVGQEVSGGAGYALRDTSGGLPEGASRGLDGPGGGVVDAGVRISADDLAKLGERDRRDVEDYLSRRWSCDVGVIGDVRDIESLPENSRADIVDAYEDGETWAIYSRGDKKIYIFAGKNGDESLSGVLLHENVHAVVDMLGDDCREFLEAYAGQISALPYTNGVFGGMYADIQDLYAEDKAEEEFLAYSLQYVELYNKVLTKIKKSLDEPTLRYLEDKILSKLYEPAGRTDKGEAVHDNSRVQWSRVQEDNGSREREPHEISGGASGERRESGWESEAGGQPVGERYESTEEYPGRVAESEAVQEYTRAQWPRVQETVVDTKGGLQGGERRERRELGEGGERGDEGIAEEAEIASEEDALNSRIEVKDDDWTEEGGYTPTLKRTVVIDGIHNVTQVDAPNDKGDYTGSIFEYDGKAFGDLREVISYIDSSRPATIGEQVAEAEAEVNTTPTDGQKKAGNYKKGHVQVGTFDVTIENPKGSKRSGTDPDGKKWETTMTHTYGYILGTKGVDGDHIDVYISSDIDGWNGRKVFVVDQYNPDGSFDEHKVMLGFNDKVDAIQAYLSNYEDGWEKGRRLVFSTVSIEDFEKWIESSHRKQKPFKEYKSVHIEESHEGGKDELHDEVRQWLGKKGLEPDEASRSAVMRYFKIGYNRAGKILNAIAEENAANQHEEATPAQEQTTSTSTEGYTIVSKPYTNKQGKTLDTHLVTFDRDFSKEEQKRIRAMAKEKKGWPDRETGGYMLRSREDAEEFAASVMNINATSTANAPISLSDIESAIKPAETEISSSPADKPADAEAKPEKKPSKWVDDEDAEEFERLRKILHNGLGQLNSGFPPELLYAGGKMSYLMMKHGVRKFAEYATAMIEELGDAIRPHLKSLYNFTRSTEEVMESEWADELTPFDEVMKFDTANFGKPNVDAMATAENVVAEEASQQHLEDAVNTIKDSIRQNPDGSTSQTINEGGTEIEVTEGDFIPGVYPPIDDKPTKPGKKKPSKSKPTEQKPTTGQLDLFEEEEEQIINDIIDDTTPPEPKPEAELSGDSADYQERTRQERDLVDDIVIEIMKRTDMRERGDEKVTLTMRDIRGMLENYSLLADISATDLQELVERAMTILTRTAAKTYQLDPRKGYDRVVAYYNMQPSLNARDSERLIKQQYSTPTPFGYVMGQFVNAKNDAKSILEPSAGNGALTIMFNPATVHVNDIDERRLENLRTLGYGTVTAQNGLLPFEGEKVDGVLTNPPFGSVTEKVYDGVFKISSLEGQMAINALDSMKDGGRAAIIIGGNTSYRTNGSMNPKDAAFFGYLYSHYNVSDVINISGKALYARNGTGYDVRMILINGRKTGEFSRVYPPVKSKARAEQVTTFDELYKRVQDDIQQVFQMGNKPADVQPEAESTADGGTSTPVRSGGNNPNKGARERPDTTGYGSGSASGSNIEQPSSGNGGSRPVGVDNGDAGNAGGTDNVQRPQSSASGSNGSGSPQNDGGRSGGNGRDAASSRPDSNGERLAVKPDLTTEKVPYPNQSDNGFTLLSVVPAAQAEVLQRSLAEIGDVDQFLVDELGYSSKEELYSYLAAEQIDSVALAIHQMNKGNAFIIGDMTGVGKGRQGAALIRYGVRQGRCPIYFTQKPTLFTDNYRDLADIGSSELRPFIIASNPKDANIVDANGNVVHKLPSKKEQERVFDYIMQNGKLPEEYDYVLTTYDQIKNGTADYSQNEDGTWNTEARKLPKKSKGYTTADYNGQARRDALARLAMGVAPGEGNIAILDESHTVGGDSGCGRYMQMLTSGAYGVTFLSATFAKRADNMPVYAQRTAIAEAGVNVNELIEAIAKGGVTLQEIMSKQLVESGQMIRRERSFEGVTIDWLSVEEETDRKQREQFNEVANIFNSIRNFQNDFIKPIIDGMNEDAAETGGTVGQTQGTKDMGVRNTPFASKMYNLVNQLLFALKVDAVADRVIENLSNGFKPVISFTNTMEGFLASAPKGVAMDEVPNFSLTLMRALDGVMRFTENDADQNSEGGQITVGQLSPEGQAAYNAIKGKIMNLSADLPISPMDAIRMKIEEAGYTVAEITGRTTQLNRTEDGRYIVEGRKDRDKKAAMRDFNAGKLDVLMINKSGSTGISLHASSKFEDQRQRVMVFAQFQSDINDEVQMRGRIDRSGQVVRGRYEYIMSTIPAEQRIQMMFKAKLKSLDANTTSSQKSKFNEMEIVDYLNKYGDEVVWEYMKEHPELSDRLGDPLKMLQDKDEDGAARTSEKEDSSQKSDCAGKISRYLAFLSVEEQDEIFKEITEAYKVKIQLLDDAGENDLEITTMPLRAETKSKQIWHNGENPGSGNAFADNTYVEEVEVDVLKKPMKRTEIEDMTRKLMGDKLTTAAEYDQTRYGMKDGELNWGRYADKKIEEVNNFFSAKADDAVAKMKETGESRVSKAREKSVKDALKARAKGENTFSDQEIESLADVVAKEAQDKEEMKQYRRREEINNVRDQITHLLSRLRAGHIYVVPQDLKQATADMFTQTFGTFVGFKFNKSYTLGSSTAIFATLDGRRKVELALNDKAIETIIRCTDTALRYSPKEINAISMDNWDSKVPTKTRQTRHIITGNLLQALVDTEKGEKTKGNLISFSTNDGNTRQGILMSENFKPTDLRSSVPLRSRLKQIQDGITVVSENGDVQIERVDFDWKHRGEYELKVPKSKQRGGIYSMHTDLLKLIDGHNFNSKGNYMIGYILPENLAKVVDMLSRAPFNLTVLEESKLTETTDSSQRNVEDDSDLRFRIREEEPPKQTGIGYEPQKRQTGAITDEQINELNSQFAQRERDGYGAYSDAEVSMENDPWSKAWGESIRTKRQQKQFAERERKRMRDRAKSLSSVLGIDIEVIEDASSLKGKKQRAKGWYDTKTGKITVVVGNHNSAADMEATILHEAVAHHGLRQLLGEHFDEFLDKVYEAADNGIKEQIDLLASRNGWNRRVATEEYLAGLAEETEFDRAEERVSGWFDKIKRFFIDMLFKAGFKHIKPGSIGDNELRYILWRSYQNLANPGRYRAFEWEAEDVAMQYKLQVGEYGHREDATERKVAEAGELYELNERFNRELEMQIDGTLPAGHVYNMGMPSKELLSTGIARLPIRLSASVLNVKSNLERHAYDLSSVRNLVNAIQKPWAIFSYGDKGKAQNLIIGIEDGGRQFLVGISINPTVKGVTLEINSIRNVFPKNNHEWINWINEGKLLRVDGKKEIQAIIAKLRMNPVAFDYVDLDNATKIVENFENPTIGEQNNNNGGEDTVLFRDGDFTPRDRKLAADVYEKMLSRGSWQFREATQDSMLGLKTLYESILGSNTRIENVAGYENAYLYENRMSSANNGEQHQYFSRFMKPLLDSIHKLCGSKELDRRILTDYMMAKHGLERNEYMRNEAAANGEDTERDFAGLCGLTGEDDWQVAETVAQQMVDDYESDHDTAELWDNVKKATNATLEKIYLSGLISEDTYNKVLGMYDFYIPLRGWDETTSDEVYGYLTSKDGPLMGSVFKTAEGRESKADDPIATIAMMADDAIRQGNRNIMKQRFLNFVHGNPSDLVSVNEMWLQHNDVTNEWEPVFADLQPDMTHAEVESEIAKFEAKMEALRTAEPDKYKKGGDARNIPYKVVRGNLNEHQVLVKRNGRTYVITINGNPRAAQALNGLTNPNVEMGGVIGNMLKLGEYVNRHLSAFYTTRNPDFVVSNFMRDMLYSNCMTWVKENPRYALRFHKNFGKVNPLTLRRLLSKWENDNLSDSNYLEKMFKEFMLNGGETGYTSVKDIEGHKRTIASELKKQGSTGRKAWNALGMQLDLLNRSAENCARFAAFLTSREMGRTLDRSIYDAKEVSVNFNKKGSGGKFVNATGQKFLGKLGSYLGGGGRIAFVFWNAGIQGMTNFGRAGKRNPGKAIGGTTALFTLGYVIPLLAQMLGGGDGDDDDKNAYYNLPEYVRRSNICFKAGEQWITIPLPIEYRAIYGMGELACGVISGNERYSNSELTRQMASQISQVMPLDMLEGGGGISPFIPSAFKPMTEAYILNKGWTGLPVYKDTPYNKNDPEWTKAYQSADQHLVAFTRWLNETSGGNDYKKGTIDINPAKLEYLLSGTFGGAVSTTGKLKKMGETALGTREFEWRNMLLANRVIKSGDERTANRKLQNEYYKYLTEYEETNRLRKKYENAADDGILGYAERVDFLYNSPEYLRFEIFEKYKPDIDAIREEIKEETNPEAKKELQEELFSTMRELVDELHDVGK